MMITCRVVCVDGRRYIASYGRVSWDYMDMDAIYMMMCDGDRLTLTLWSGSVQFRNIGWIFSWVRRGEIISMWGVSPRVGVIAAC